MRTIHWGFRSFPILSNRLSYQKRSYNESKWRLLKKWLKLKLLIFALIYGSVVGKSCLRVEKIFLHYLCFKLFVIKNSACPDQSFFTAENTDF